MNLSTWTPEEQCELVRLAAEGLRVADIAKALGYTRNAIIGRARRTGVALTFKVAPAKPKTPRPPRIPRAPREPRARLVPADKQLIRDLYMAGETLAEIAWRTGRSIGSIPGFVRDLPRRRTFDTSKRYDRAFKIAAVAAALTGEPMRKTAKRLSIQVNSILAWKGRPDIFDAASALADRIKAAHLIEQQRAAQIAETEAEAERIRVATHNEPIFAQMNTRHREVCERRIAGETLEAIGATYGVTRERVRQIEARWRCAGLIVPGARQLSDAARKFAPRGVKSGRKPKHHDFWAEARAMLRPDKRKGEYRMTDAERQRRSEHMRRVSREYHAARASHGAPA